MTRREFLTRISVVSGLGLTSLSAFGYARFFEPGWLELNTISVPLKRQSGFKKIRLLHLSDFHYGPYVSLQFIEEAVTLGGAQNPDVICLTGDFITTKKIDRYLYRKVLKLLPKIAPTYACLGNHDGGKWAGSRLGFSDHSEVRQLLFDAGIFCLQNQASRIKIHNQELTFIGIGDYWSEEARPELAFKNIPKKSETPTILLSHNPDSKDILDEFQWDLMLCGHTHGGQLVIPLFGTPFAPVRDHRFVSGLNSWNDRWIYTTRGVGNLHGMRVNCRPEISILEITG